MSIFLIELIYRFIETSHNNRNLTFYRLSSSNIPLEKALTLDTTHNQLPILM